MGWAACQYVVGIIKYFPLRESFEIQPEEALCTANKHEINI